MASAAGFSVRDMAGKVHRLSDYKGQWVLVNFWATWCPPCREEIPELSALYNRHRNKDLEVLGIAMDYRNPQQVRRFANSMDITYPVVLGDREIAAQIGPVSGLPTTYLYNPQGKLSAYHVGPLTEAEVERYISSHQKK